MDLHNYRARYYYSKISTPLLSNNGSPVFLAFLNAEFIKAKKT